MARPDKISRFLPIYFSNGNSVRRFGKHCPNCEVMVGAQHMEGLASKHDERIFLAATACCPSCSHKFSVGCVITDDKRVHRVVLPYWIFQNWLKRIARKDQKPLSDDSLGVHESQSTTIQGGLVLPSNVILTRSEQILGRFNGKSINAWVEFQGKRFKFDRVAPPGCQARLDAKELLIEDSLIYRQASV